MQTVKGIPGAFAFLVGIATYLVQARHQELEMTRTPNSSLRPLAKLIVDQCTQSC